MKGNRVGDGAMKKFMEGMRGNRSLVDLNIKGTGWTLGMSDFLFESLSLSSLARLSATSSSSGALGRDGSESTGAMNPIVRSWLPSEAFIAWTSA